MLKNGRAACAACLAWRSAKVNNARAKNYSVGILGTASRASWKARAPSPAGLGTYNGPAMAERLSQ
jgi:hypothetical protein